MMDHQSPLNLDRLAAATSQNLIRRARALGNEVKSDEVDNLVTKALGVLQEEGVYACLLFLYSRTPEKEKKIAEITRDELLSLAVQLPFGWEKPANKPAVALAFVSDRVAADLHQLLLTRQAMEQALIYARYGSKAWKAETG